ncbi:MAG: type II toxin-antitoxin system RelE/ParE family toxin [Acidobacteriaceae bacterium]
MSKSRVPRLVVTQTAARTIVEQANYYAMREGSALADRWEAAVWQALTSLPKMPGCGAPCNFRSPELKNLRRAAVPGFARHLIFYEHLRDQGILRVVHVLHGARDIESLLRTQTAP